MRETHTRRSMLALLLTVPALVIATQLYAGYRAVGAPVSFAGMFVVQLCHWQLWAIVGPVVWASERRWPFEPHRMREGILYRAAIAPLVAAVVLGLFLLTYHAAIRVPGLSAWFVGMERSIATTASFFFMTHFHVDVLVYAAIVVAAHASRTAALLSAREHETLRLQAELVGAKLTTLRTQLQPHFLFNTLHTIGSLVLQRDNQRAVSLLAELGELLRLTLANRDTALAPLREEVSLLRRYLHIEQARFEDRLEVEWRIQPAAEDALIPPFILQPLIENAFRHGISRHSGQSRLRIEAGVQTHVLRVSVYNDGPPLVSPFSADNYGYGLKNVAARLSAADPPGHIELANEGAGVRVTLLLPFSRAGHGKET